MKCPECGSDSVAESTNGGFSGPRSYWCGGCGAKGKILSKSAGAVTGTFRVSINPEGPRDEQGKLYRRIVDGQGNPVHVGSVIPVPGGMGRVTQITEGAIYYRLEA